MGLSGGKLFSGWGTAGEPLALLLRGYGLVVMSITTMTFAARDFSARRGASDEHTLQGSVRSEQRSLAEKELPPEGLRRIWPVAALLVGHRSTSGYAPSSRLAPGQIRCNERHRSYVHDHLVNNIHP